MIVYFVRIEDYADIYPITVRIYLWIRFGEIQDVTYYKSKPEFQSKNYFSVFGIHGFHKNATLKILFLLCDSLIT